MENTRVRFLVYSLFPQLKSQTALEIRVNWVALHYCSRRRKLAGNNQTPKLWHTNHHV